MKTQTDTTADTNPEAPGRGSAVSSFTNGDGPGEKVLQHAAPLRDIVHGYPVVPLSRWDDPGDHPGKRPIRKGWQHDPIRSGLEWLEGDYTGNHGVVCMPEDRLLVVDVDTKKGARAARQHLAEWVEASGVDLTRFPAQRTPSGGRHLIGRLPEDYPADTLPNGAATDDGTIETLRHKQFVRAPGRTPKGEYAEIRPLPPLDLLPEWPAEFLDCIREAAGSGSGTSSPPPQEELRAPSVECLREVVGKIPNAGPEFESREPYIEVGAAIKAAAGPEHEGEALELFQAWASRWEDGDNPPERVRKDFGGLHAPYRVGWSYLQDLAAEYSDYNPAEDAFEADVSAEEPTPEPDYTIMADVEPEKVEWLWPGRIPLGSMTAWDGLPGLGKSGVTLDLAARVSTDADMPDGREGLDAPAGVVLISAEDGLGDTVRPRLEAAGADLTRVAHLNRITVGGKERFIQIQDADRIERAIRAVDARLVVVDPLMAFLGTKDKVDAYRDQDMRTALLPLSDLARQYGVAVVLVRHLTKGQRRAIYSGGGSVGIIGAARAGFLVAEHPERKGVKVLASTKNNLAPKSRTSSFMYRTEGAGEDGDVLRIEWEGPCSLSADALLQDKDNRPTPARDEARQFLEDLLSTSDDGSLPVKEIREAVRDAGLSFKTVRRAKQEAGISATREGGFGEEGAWIWSLPWDPAEPLEDLVGENNNTQSKGD